MPPTQPTRAALLRELETLTWRLEEAESTLAAIHSGAVDALLIGDQVFTLEGAERPYHELVDRMREGAAFLDPAGGVLYANRYLADLLATPLSRLLGSRWGDLVAAAEQDRVAAWLAAPGEPLESTLLTPAGEPRPVLLAGAALALSGQPGHAVLVTDLRARRAAEARILRLNRLYALASAVNAAIAKQPPRAELFQAFCRLAVGQGGYRLAWVGVPDPASGAVTIVAAAGATAYLDGLALSSRDVPAGRGPSGIALREGRCVVVNDFLEAEAIRPWHDQGPALWPPRRRQRPLQR